MKFDRLEIEALKGSGDKKPKDYFTQSCLRLSGKYRTMKNEAEDPNKKKEYEEKQLAYFKRSQSKGGGTASVAYSLAYGDLKACFDAKRQRKVKEAKAKYAEAVKAFENITKNFPTSSEAVNAYKQLGLLHEYFKKLELAKSMYEEYLKRIATPDVKGKIDKLDVSKSQNLEESKVEEFEDHLQVPPQAHRALRGRRRRRARAPRHPARLRCAHPVALA